MKFFQINTNSIRLEISELLATIRDLEIELPIRLADLSNLVRVSFDGFFLFFGGKIGDLSTYFDYLCNNFLYRG